MEAIILVGGLGTRLGQLTYNTPKPMLEVRGVPFLRRLISHLELSGFERLILAMGFKHEVIKNYFDSAPSFFPRIEYSIEVEPLGTGGGIKNALSLVKMDNFFVFNGDTFLDLDYRRMQENHLGNGADITVGSCFLENTDRYGVMHVCEEGEIIGFEEKQGTEPGIINGGVYLINRHRLERVLSQIKIGAFSFEEVILSNFDLGLVRRYFPSAGYFLDIGIPSDYERACKELFLD